MQTNRRNDGPLIAIAIGVLLTVTVFFVAYSYKTSDDMDRAAVATGGSTSSEKADDKPVGVTTGTSNVPPPTAAHR